MNKSIVTAFVVGASFSAPAFAQDSAPADLGGFRLEGLATYEGDDGKAIGYGVGVGYDVQAGGAVLGIEAEAIKPGDEECATDALGKLCLRTDRDLYVGGRVGAAVAPNILVYAKAGYTHVRLQGDFDPVTGASSSFKNDLDGVRVGGGIQLGLGRNLYVKGEYRYSNYEQGFDKHTGAVGVGFKF